MVMEGIQEDMGEGNMLCTNHPYKNSTPGGICAFCLQEKLGKLVSSFPSAIFPSSSSSSTPSFRSDFGGPNNIGSSTSSSSTTLPVKSISKKGNEYQFDSIRKSRMPFLLTQRRKKKSNGCGGVSGSDSTAAVFKRSQSTATPRNRLNFLEVERNGGEYSPHKRGFWSFLYLPSKKSGNNKESTFASSSSSSVNGSMRGASREKKREEFVVVEENDESPDDQASSFDRKVSRSRSVGCGSRSFSGDFFERISTGFGDCTLRRVESQREGKPKVGSVHHRTSGASGQDCIKERVRCGGIFSGFMITSSSSSSSSSSYLVSSEENVNGNGRPSMASVGHHHHQLAHGRSRSWGWAFASPMRAFTKTSTGKREASSNKNTTPNLAVIPSLLTARG
ncbi:PREDICTED: uncharacterized protein DDB_G0271670-like [Ipomoea nil]|uniref:uncharacterized protein DDB_G0271670-like n=1 Tax=Ipomoea nil TaxID=35883 RepID=UPI0009016962|nr:PREDICTED: uncharacterized protein DDB_G0271670-like [Ipomoea nil]